LFICALRTALPGSELRKELRLHVRWRWLIGHLAKELHGLFHLRQITPTAATDSQVELKPYALSEGQATFQIVRNQRRDVLTAQHETSTRSAFAT
jgi:hypothetical protein